MFGMGGTPNGAVAGTVPEPSLVAAKDLLQGMLEAVKPGVLCCIGEAWREFLAILGVGTGAGVGRAVVGGGTLIGVCLLIGAGWVDILGAVLIP